jgi:hypothetical protein
MEALKKLAGIVSGYTEIMVQASRRAELGG